MTADRHLDDADDSTLVLSIFVTALALMLGPLYLLLS
jgi:hypothetical protein